MEKLHNKAKWDLSNLILNGLNTLNPEHGLNLETIYQELGPPPQFKMGHYAFACFRLAKSLRLAPVKIAEELKKSIEVDGEMVACTAPTGPYLNFFLKDEYLASNFLDPIISGNYFEETLLNSPEKIMYEYSQPNTHKELHVGHMRNLCLGNALIRLGRYLGHNIIASTYPGDVGTHVAKTLWYLKFHYQGQMPVENKGTWLGAMYSKANNLLEEQLGTEQEDKNRTELTKILKELESGSGEYFDLWQTTRAWSIELMKEVYAWADVEFDKWYFESEVDAESVGYAKKLYEEGKLIKDQGAIGMDLSDDKLGFCMLIKTDGTGLYATKDVMLAQKKFEEFKLDKNIYVVDKRQSHHFKQVFKVLEKLGLDAHESCVHLAYDFVELPDGAMSSRKGNIVPLLELSSKMQETIHQNYLAKYDEIWTQEEIYKTAQVIADGAIKFGMLRIDPNRKIVFDMVEWLKIDGETGPYLQYVYARINSLCQKLSYDDSLSADWTKLSEDSEQELLYKISEFNDIAVMAYKSYKTSTLCSYLYDLGKLFNRFYVECPIGKCKDEALKNSRLKLAKSCSLIIARGLSLLGIKVPERM